MRTRRRVQIIRVADGEVLTDWTGGRLRFWLSALALVNAGWVHARAGVPVRLVCNGQGLASEEYVQLGGAGA